MSVSGLIASMLSLILTGLAVLFIVWYLVSGNSEIVKEIRQLKNRRKVKKRTVSIHKSDDAGRS